MPVPIRIARFRDHDAGREMRSGENGRGDRIRTCDLLVPNQALYQAKLHPADRTARVGQWRRVSMTVSSNRGRRSKKHLDGEISSTRTTPLGGAAFSPVPFRSLLSWRIGGLL